MSLLFLTDPDNQSDDVKPIVKKQTGNRSIRFKENVASALQTLGIPKGTAELAVIDMRGAVITAMHKKQTPVEAASALVASITRIYKTDGNWHYL